MKRPIQIISSGAYTPQKCVISGEIDRRLEKPDGWTERTFGISQRFYASPSETTSQMGCFAAQSALDNAGILGSDLDCIMAACGVMEQPIPSTAVLIQNKLGLGESGIAAFDINSTCLSFITALDLAADAITLGRYEKVLVVSSEIASCGLDWNNPEAAAIFGDGAAAIIVEKSTNGSGIIASHMETYGVLQDVCRLESGGTRMRPEDDIDDFLDRAKFKMDGRSALSASLSHMPKFIDRLMAKAQLAIDEIDLVVPHQASGMSLTMMQRRFELSDSRIVNNFVDIGNQIAASIPNALDTALKAGRIKRGDKIMLVGTSAGISLGAIILEY